MASKDTGLQPHGGPSYPRGHALLLDPLLNKGTAFTEAERDALGLRGLLPPHVFSMEEQVKRVMGNFRRKPDALEKYIFLTSLQNRNETLFYRLVQENLEEMIPIIYTPVVGQACLEFGAIFRRPRGLYISIRDRGRIADILTHWPVNDVRMIVVTDGERILGLGDLGALGMGIPIGKLSLYTACAGVHPGYTLPIMLDVGTDNTTLHHDPLYIGLNQRRARGAEYDAFLEEFVTAVAHAFPKALLQWEDFGNTNAFRLLHQYRERICSFNDDIQGTAGVALAGLLGSLRISGAKLRDQRVLFLGAGEAGTGIADLLVAAMREEGLSEAEARQRCWFVDSQGLVVQSRLAKLAEHKRPYAHDHAFVATLAEAVNALKPTALIGVSGQAQAFTEPIVRQMAALNRHPVVFALSNPTSKAECTAEQAYTWTDGRAIFASGSPFPTVKLGEREFVPGQGNNVYIFPGVGLGALVAEASQVTDRMFLRGARTLASLVSAEDIALGRVFPSLTKIREVSLEIATAVAEEAFKSGLARRARPADLKADIAARMFVPEYQSYA
ncbi:NAD-dependent malic enzyme [Opitutus terrae]|uniref:Malolactic enzyme n=1 Tax=Opitutus terrae (strain DSM 11246 / JCM 15787 / PB90-1) TaxID=452637 RepID=B1ZTB8_OPITP|nr:NAD-dependent malic enzyme [Opitutus terrae]ACB76572.1 Malate dehydrogenase (oxaloacetate-decarboxylating) (NADP(+)) [Opitutus terrae PB90-1]